MPKRMTGGNVFDEAVNRMVRIYEQGHRVVVSFSAGKDSGVALEVCKIAAAETGRLPVEAIIRDEEVMLPGTYEYAERIHHDPLVHLNWIWAGQPIINIFNRELPYWWVFDDRLQPEQWMRQPPPWAVQIPDKDITHMTIPQRFPPAEGKELISVIGLRVVESRGRLYGIHSAGGHLTKPNSMGVRRCNPVYDWTDSDVWLAIQRNRWDYNSAYDVLHRLGLPKKDLRIAPPTQSAYGVRILQLAAQAWPQWFDRLATRVPGTRAVAKYGIKVVQPQRRLNETWETCFRRTCIEQAPPWIAERASAAMDQILSAHHKHSGTPLPEVSPCYHCFGNAGSWKGLANIFYLGDPFGLKFNFSRQDMKYVEPEAFRPGSGKWGGSPSF